MAELDVSINSFKQNFDDQLTCSVCLDQYTNPKTLPCLHSFCLKCIEKLSVEIKIGKYHISCPICRIDHLVPQGGVINFPNGFQINKWLELRKQLSGSRISQQTTSSTTCPTHNDPLKVYCETCCQVICRDCTISKEHNTHNFSLISECYPKHHQQLQDSLDLVKHKLADVNTAVTNLITREREVLQQGQQLKEQINTHMQQIIDHVKRSCTHLSQQVDTIVQQKTQVLTAQRQQAQKLHTQLENCQEMMEQSLKEWTKQQILTEKHKMMEEMNIATQHADPAVFQPIEIADMQFKKAHTTAKEIGLITGTTYGKSTLKVSPHCIPHHPSTATLTLRLNDGSPFCLPPSLISCTLFSPSDEHSVKCDITQTQHPGIYNITFTPSTGPDQLTVLVAGVAIPDCPLTIRIRGEQVDRVIDGLSSPCGIAVSDNGDIIVVENGAHCITILNNEGIMRSYGTLGTRNERQFTYPRGVTIINNGHILVTDNHRLQKLTNDGVCVKSVGSGNSGSGQLQLNCPKGIAVHPTTGQIFVADKRNNCIKVFTNDLSFSYIITLHGNKQFQWSVDVELDNEGYLYVAECYNHCITKLTTTGQYITRFGSKGSAPGQLSRPTSLTINNNLVYVCERGNHRVSIFDTTGKFLHCFGKKGNGEGEFNKPFGIAMDTSGNLYISDFGNNRIVVC